MNSPRIMLTLLLVFISQNVAFAQLDVEPTLTANFKLQEQIRATANAFFSSGNSESEVKANWKGFRELAKLKELAKDEKQLVEELAVYATIEQREEQWQVVEALLVLEMLNLKPTIPIRVLAPHLDSDNPQVRELARKWFQNLDTYNSGVPSLQYVNFQDYIDYINLMLNMNEEIPSPFIEYIYERSPEQALLVFLQVGRRDETIAQLQEMRKNIDARLQQENNGQNPIRPLPPAKEVKQQDLRGKQLPTLNSKEIRLAEHIVSNAIWLKANGFQKRHQEASPEAEEQLAKQSEHSEWWVRLYVAEIMRQHPEFRQTEILEKLGQDRNPLVSKQAKLAIE